MTLRKSGRRMFLLGAGSFALSVPFLPSLLRAGKAHALAVVPKRFVCFGTDHGNVHGQHMWPADSAASTPTTVLGDHTVHSDAIMASTDGTDTVLSPVLRAPSSLLTPALVAKMNLLRGLDVPWYCSHGRHMLGNYGPLSRAVEPGGTTVPNQPSIDQVMAHSTAVYRTEPRRRSMHLGFDGMSTGWSNPTARSGDIQIVPTAEDPRTLFDQIYTPPVDPGMMEPPRPLVVDRVLESYRRVRSGAHGPGARLGAADRIRLDDYMDRLRTIQASLTARVAASCSAVRSPTFSVGGRAAVYGEHQNQPEIYGPGLYGVYNDILVAAFMCDSSRIAVMSSPDDFHGGMSAVGGFHEVAHTANAQPEREAMLQLTSQNFFRMVYCDLIAKLDAVADEGGGTMLDNSMVVWTQESGPSTHHNDSQPVIMAGSAAGYFRTGLYVDYRNRAAEYANGEVLAANGRRPGLHYYQFLATALHAMCVPQDEWPRGAAQPYSDSDAVPGWFEARHPYLDRIFGFSTESLPVITL